MKNRGSLLSLKPEREDFNGWKISVVKKNGKEVEPVGKEPSVQYQAHHKLQSKASSYPVPLSLRPMVLDRQQPCPVGSLLPPHTGRLCPITLPSPHSLQGPPWPPALPLMPVLWHHVCAMSVAIVGCPSCRLSLLSPQCLLSVTSSPNAPVGKYNLHVKTDTNIYKPENGAIYLLFNPWCEGEWSYN